MKNLIWIVPLALIAIVGYSAMGSYNGFVSLDEDVDGQWANVETQYQRRFDLIPNLVATVKGVAEFEQETLTAVTEARASAFNAMQAVGEGTGSIADFQQSNLVLGRAMNGLLGYSERYPELKANQNFSDLQAQLEGTENRIAVARKDFNASVKAYNGKVRRFPGSLWAGMFGFEQRDYFESVAGSGAAPAVDFGS
ncbi:MAG: LemA family protein [Bacteroidota bacterium]|nr:LemA family protein [Bacteroidota bacterium]